MACGGITDGPKQFMIWLVLMVLRFNSPNAMGSLHNVVKQRLRDQFFTKLQSAK